MRGFLAASQTADLVEAGQAERKDVAVALANLREIYEYLVSDRAPP